MKKLFLIFGVCTWFIACGQRYETMENKKVTELFVKNYNEENYEAIFEMFSSDMKAFLPLNKTKSFLKDERSNSGKIKNYTFLKYKQSILALYKVESERSNLSLQIAIDKSSKIIGLSIEPYTEDFEIKDATNHLSLKHSFTQQQIDLIYSSCKKFPNESQLAFAVIKNGNTKFYGTQRISDSIYFTDNHQSIFEIGSITKVFTSTLLADLVTKKTIKLDDYINKHLKFPLKDNTKITFKTLANHTSGLPKLPSNLDFGNVDPSNPYKNYLENDLQEYLTKSLTLENKGTSQYSNLGTGLLAYTLTQIEKKSFEELLQEKVFSRYNMPNSTTDKNKLTLDFIEGLDAEGNVTANWDFEILEGAGSILSNVQDLSQFALAQFNESNKTLQLTHKETIKLDVFNSVGLGWHIKPKNGWLWHNGGTGGYRSCLVVDAKNKNAVILLSNISSSHENAVNIDKLCFGLMKTL